MLATLIGGWGRRIGRSGRGRLARGYFRPFPVAPAGISEQIADSVYTPSCGLIIWACEHYRRVIRRLDEGGTGSAPGVDELRPSE